MDNYGPNLRRRQEDVFELKMDNARDLYPVFKALQFREDCAIDVTENGMRIIVDDQSCLQAIAYIKNEIFSSFVLREENVIFRTSIGFLADSLNMFGSTPNTALKMVYGGFGTPLKLMLERDGIVAKSVIKSQNLDSILDFDFDTSDIAARVILKPQKLKEVFHELDLSSTSIAIKVTQKMLCISTEGDLGKIKTEFPQCSEQIERLECQEDVKFKYRLNLLKRVTPSLNISHRVLIFPFARQVIDVNDLYHCGSIVLEFYPYSLWLSTVKITTSL